jgi:cob(I)alamin adenosyltransferase
MLEVNVSDETTFYTGKGDRGDTARLGGAGRVVKSDPLLETVGAFDEATSAIGLARAMAQSEALREALPALQRRLYRMMSHLSATPEARQRYSGLTEEDLAWLEGLIERLETGLPPLEGFVLPGDSPGGAAFHLARTVARRAERRLVALAEAEPGVGPANLAFANRLSSLLFVAALVEDQLGGGALSLAREDG